VGSPILPPPDPDEATLEGARLVLEESLNQLTAEADRYFGQTVIEPADART
jgi:hypothetical protein